jgi:hypothetical protein
MAAHKVANISSEAAQKIQQLEKDFDVCALAMEPGLELAELNEDELSAVKVLEKELGVQLVIYREC